MNGNSVLSPVGVILIFIIIQTWIIILIPTFIGWQTERKVEKVLSVYESIYSVVKSKKKLVDLNGNGNFLDELVRAGEVPCSLDNDRVVCGDLKRASWFVRKFFHNGAWLGYVIIIQSDDEQENRILRKLYSVLGKKGQVLLVR